MALRESSSVAPVSDMWIAMDDGASPLCSSACCLFHTRRAWVRACVDTNDKSIYGVMVNICIYVPEITTSKRGLQGPYIIITYRVSGGVFAETQN